MKPRCDGNRPGVYLSGFICCLDADHDGRCKPYQPPTVDEWRASCMLLNVRCDDLRKPGVPQWTASIAGVGRGDGDTAGAAVVELAEYLSSARDLDAQVIAAVQRWRKG